MLNEFKTAYGKDVKIDFEKSLQQLQLLKKH